MHFFKLFEDFRSCIISFKCNRYSVISVSLTFCSHLIQRVKILCGVASQIFGLIAPVLLVFGVVFLFCI